MRCRPCSSGLLSSTAPFTLKVELISSEEEEQKPPLHAAAASTNDEFAARMEEALRRSLISRGSVAPSPPCR